MEYTQSQWILFFFLYCFLGWIWESCYVSAHKKEWINRGFLHGPVLPIYGFGAIIVLWLTLPVRNNLFLVFLLGLTGADILEYTTGTVMERLFHMRYWDYSNQPFNLNGHICLFCTIGWGVFSVALIKYLHPPIEKLVLQIPAFIADPVSVACVAGFAADVTKSVQSALDVRELLEKMGENNERMAALEAKLDGAAASLSRSSEEFKSNIKAIEESIVENRIVLHLKKEVYKASRQKFLEDKLQEYRDRKSRFLTLLNEKANAAVKEVREQMELETVEGEKLRLEKLLSEVEEFRDRLKKTEMDIASWKNREYKKAVSIIRRNPSAVSRHFKAAFEEIKELGQTKK